MKQSQLASAYLDQTTSDVTFACGPTNSENLENVPAHQLVLALRSPVFKTMFFDGQIFDGKVYFEKPTIRMTDATGDGVKEFLQMFYKDDIRTNIENASEVIELLKKYKVDEFVGLYSDVLQCNLSINQLCKGLELAEQYDMLQLKKFCVTRILNNHKQLFESEEFVCCSPNMLQTILRLEDFKQFGKEIFFMCIQWAIRALKSQNGTQNEPTLSDIRVKLGDFVDLIEFSSMKCKELMMILYDFDDFFIKKDLTAVHSVLALKYSENHAFLETIRCDLMPNALNDIRKHYITDDHVVSFQSSEKVLFVGFEHPQIFQHEWVTSAVVQKISR